MSRVHLIARLARRDLRHRPGEAVMIVVVIVAATAALSLGLMLHGVTSHPYETTRAATEGPDVVATDFPSGTGAATATPASPAARATVAALGHAAGVAASAGPFPVAFPVLRAGGHTDAVLAEGRTAGMAAVDQPKVTEGTWVRPGGIVVERSFAEALGIRTGARVTLGGRSFTVDGVAVTAAFPTDGVGFLEGSARWPNPGIVWTTAHAAASLATSRHPLGYISDLRLAHGAAARAFADRYDTGGYTNNDGGLYVIPWQLISHQDGLLIAQEQKILLLGSWLLALLAAASLAVLVGGRMAEQRRRVGLLKAVGSSPGLVAGVLLSEHLVLSGIAAVVGLVVGRVTAPLLTAPGAALLGSAGAPQVTVATVLVVVIAALTVAALATCFPAVRAARTSTVAALADASRAPRRHRRLLAWSAALPVPLLLAARLVARRPRRAVLATLSVTVTVSGVVAVLFAHATLAVSQFGTVAGPSNIDRFDVGFISQSAQEDKVLLAVTIMLAALAAVNALFITRAAIRDGSHALAVSRALGATPEQLGVALSASQAGPALVGALLGIAGGFGFFSIADQGGAAGQPPAWWLAAAVLAAVALVTLLTSVPARLGIRAPVAERLQGEA